MTAPHAAPADPRRRLMIMVGVGAALGLLLLIGGRVLAGGGSGDDIDTFSAPVSSARTAPTTTAPAVAEGPAAAPVETFEVFTTKNPFIALRSATPAGAASAQPAVATAGAPIAAPVPATVAGAPTASPAAPAATPSGAAATSAAGGQATEPSRSGTRVSLLDVFAEGDRTVASVKVNDTVSKVAAGDTFASNFKVVSLDPAERCGRFLYGDDQFRLCKGEEVLK